jgi:hypothetical protein
MGGELSWRALVEIRRAPSDSKIDAARSRCRSAVAREPDVAARRPRTDSSAPPDSVRRATRTRSRSGRGCDARSHGRCTHTNRREAAATRPTPGDWRGSRRSIVRARRTSAWGGARPRAALRRR